MAGRGCDPTADEFDRLDQGVGVDVAGTYTTAPDRSEPVAEAAAAAHSAVLSAAATTSAWDGAGAPPGRGPSRPEQER